MKPTLLRKAQVTNMLKKLFDFSGSTKMKLAHAVRLVGILAAIVIFAFGAKEIMDVKHMKAVLDVTKLIMGDVLLFLTKKYLVWVALCLVLGIGGFYTLRYLDHKDQAAKA